MSVIKENLMSRKGYTPYCGDLLCRLMPRTVIIDGQFYCPACAWESDFDEKFIEEYLAKWKNQGEFSYE